MSTVVQQQSEHMQVLRTTTSLRHGFLQGGASGKHVLRRKCVPDTLVLAKQSVSSIVYKRSLQRNIKLHKLVVLFLVCSSHA